ncbi:MAG: polysaccharide pyruvyl transferase family protein [Muribaculaceae bacterium]|nr:polysaccharide pyruvyl transferase family protein [Muribaculaceae bacterium]
MDCIEKKKQLEGILKETLTPLITGDYVHVGNPYYANIGDHLIWAGEVEFLSTLPYKCLGSHNITTWQWPELSENTVIIFEGGGNFGELYPEEHDLRMEIIRRYPRNRIVILPQSVAYKSDERIAEDGGIIDSHPDLHLCLRDEASYRFAVENFPKCKKYKLPDMAFCISDSILAPYREPGGDKTLFLRRTDKEWVEPQFSIPADAEQKDWPTYDNGDSAIKMLRGLLYLGKRMPNPVKGLCFRCADKLAVSKVLDKMVYKGIDFLYPYERIITTRLHVLILGFLLNRQIEYIDNSSGKLSAYADTWLSDMPKVVAYH